MNQGEKARLLIGPTALKNKTLREYVKGLSLNDPELDKIARYHNSGGKSDSFTSRGYDTFRKRKFTSKKSDPDKTSGNGRNKSVVSREVIQSSPDRFGLTKDEADYIAKHAPDQVVESAVFGSQANSNVGPKNWLKANRTTVAPLSTTLDDQVAWDKSVADIQRVNDVNSSITTETGVPIRSTGTSAIDESKGVERKKKLLESKIFKDDLWEAGDRLAPRSALYEYISKLPASSSEFDALEEHVRLVESDPSVTFDEAKKTWSHEQRKYTGENYVRFVESNPNYPNDDHLYSKDSKGKFIVPDKYRLLEQENLVDDAGDVSLRKGATGTLDTELGEKFSFPERQFIQGMSGTNVRNITETNRAGSKPQIFNAKWNAAVQSAATKLEADGFFPEGDSDVRKPPQYNPNGTSSAFLTHKELWIAERTLDYGHIGSATNPGFHYVMNYDSNGMPEFTLWNRQTSAGMTAAETDVADTRISSGRGYEWDSVNKGRFNKHLDEVLDVITDAEFEELAPTLDYFDSLTESPFHVDDPQRDFITKNPDVNSRPNLDTDGAYLLTNNQNNISLDNHTKSEKVRIRKAAIAARIAFMKSLPTFDLETALSQGILTPYAQNAIKVSTMEEANKVDKISQEDLQTLRQNVMAEIAKGEGLTLDQILRRAVSKMPKAPMSIAALVGSFTSAFADAPEGETTAETALRALDQVEQSIMKPGNNAIMGVADKVGVGDTMRAVDNHMTDTYIPSAFGHIPFGESVMGFAYNMFKDIPSEFVGLASQFLGTPAGESSDVVPEGQQYFNAPVNRVTPYRIDEHDAKVNRGLVRDIWYDESALKKNNGGGGW